MSNRQCFEACTVTVRDEELAARFIASRDALEAAELQYVPLGAGQLYQLQPHDNVAGIVSVDEMIGVYNGRMVRSSSPGRKIYDKLMVAPQFGKCPFCGARNVSTLDHFLSKRRYPLFAVAPLNFVPCCSDCNKNKGEIAPSAANDQFFHPYFDDFNGRQWLQCDVIEGSPIAFRFSVSSDELTLSELNRVNRQFEVLRLGVLYSSLSASHYAVHRHAFCSIFEAGGEAELRSELEVLRNSGLVYDRNAWQTQLYGAIFSNDWFCGGGAFA